jgi:hypothetical protein
MERPPLACKARHPGGQTALGLADVPSDRTDRGCMRLDVAWRLRSLALGLALPATATGRALLAPGPDAGTCKAEDADHDACRTDRRHPPRRAAFATSIPPRLHIQPRRDRRVRQPGPQPSSMILARNHLSMRRQATNDVRLSLLTDLS